MKWLVFTIFSLLLLVSCAKEELPPSPPPPGGESVVGKAMGGIPITPSALPSWAGNIKYTDVTPTSVKIGDTIVVTVEKTSDVTKPFYVYAEAYVYNKKFKIWEKVLADVSKSGKVTQKWAENKGVFNIPVSAERGFESGPNYIVIYWCADKGTRNSQGYKEWDCNGFHWGLTAVEFQGVGGWPDILIEKDITNNRYKGSAKGAPPADAFTGAAKSSGTMGDAYTATYINLGNVKSEVTVIKLNNVQKFKEDLAKELVNLDPRWTTRGGATCGFLFPSSGVVSFSWLANNYWVTVKTYANALEDDKVGNYAKKSPPDKYPGDCNLLNELKTIAATLGGVCGNGVKETNEQCDKADDSACPGTCKPDCSCTMKVSTAGACGDCVINPGEQCEPPQKMDSLGLTVLSGSPCWVRDGAGTILAEGHCNGQCQCVSGKVVFPQCGNGRCDANENAQSCPVDCCGPAPSIQPAPAPACDDTDDEDYFAKGTVTTGTPSISVDDSCFDASTLKEQTCSGVKTVTCPWGCSVGKCDPKPAPSSCPDAIAAWSRDYKGSDLRDIWYSAYWDVGNWAVPTGAVKTGESASLAVLNGFDSDVDLASRPGPVQETNAPPDCGNVIAVWSNQPAETTDGSVPASPIKLAASIASLTAAKAKTATVYYSIWSMGGGWSTPAVVAVNGYDPAVDVDVFGKAVSVWVRSDGLWSSVLTGLTWSAPVKVYDATDVSLPQITWNAMSNKWIAVWITGTKAKYAVFDGMTWSVAADVPGQTGVTAVGGPVVLPGTRLHVNSQWWGIKNTAAIYVSGSDKTLIADLTIPAPAGTPFSIIVDGLFSPRNQYDFVSDKWKVVGKGNSKERFVLEGGTAATDAADTGFVDGRPSDTYVRISNADILVWHSEDEASPFFHDIYWSRQDPSTGIWSPAKRLVTLGLANQDRNVDIAPLFSLTPLGHEQLPLPQERRDPYVPWKIINPPGQPGAPAGPPPGGFGGGGGGGGGSGGAGGNLKWQSVGSCAIPNCLPNSPAVNCGSAVPGVSCSDANKVCIYPSILDVNYLNRLTMVCQVWNPNLPALGINLNTGDLTLLSANPPSYTVASDTTVVSSSSVLTNNVVYTGSAIRMDVPEQGSSNLALVLFTAFGILFITLINFVHREE